PLIDLQLAHDAVSRLRVDAESARYLVGHRGRDLDNLVRVKGLIFRRRVIGRHTLTVWGFDKSRADIGIIADHLVAHGESFNALADRNDFADEIRADGVERILRPLPAGDENQGLVTIVAGKRLYINERFCAIFFAAALERRRPGGDNPAINRRAVQIDRADRRVSRQQLFGFVTQNSDISHCLVLHMGSPQDAEYRMSNTEEANILRGVSAISAPPVRFV